MAKPTKNSLVQYADTLESCMDAIEELRAQLKPFEEQEEHLRGEIVKKLLKDGLQFVKTSSGLSFGIVKGRVSFKVQEGKEEEAIAWAQKEFPGILSLNAARLTKVVQPMLAPPPFINRVEGEPHLAVRTQEN